MQRKLARQVKYSNSWYKTKRRIKRCYERINNQKKDISNSICETSNKSLFHELRDKRVYMQDEMISSWHKGRFSRQVQHSSLGFIKKKLIDNGAYVISKSFPSTKLCPYCGTKSDMTLSDRTFSCPNCGYTEDRDIKAAKTLLMYGRYLETSGSSTPYIVESYEELIGTQVERMSDFIVYSNTHAMGLFSKNQVNT